MKKMVRAFVASMFFVSSLFMGARGVQASTGTSGLSNNDKTSELLVLKHTRELCKQNKDGSIKLAEFDSHFSHESHASHESHSSHYSGY